MSSKLSLQNCWQQPRFSPLPSPLCPVPWSPKGHYSSHGQNRVLLFFICFWMEECCSCQLRLGRLGQGRSDTPVGCQRGKCGCYRLLVSEGLMQPFRRAVPGPHGGQGRAVAPLCHPTGLVASQARSPVHAAITWDGRGAPWAGSGSRQPLFEPLGHS